MGYIDNNLVRNETVVYRTKLHWWLWASDIFVAVILTLIALFIFATLMASSAPGRTSKIDGGAALLALLSGCTVPLIWLVGLLMFIADLISWSTSEFGVTNRRILAKYGWIRRRVAEINLSQFESCQLAESLVGRLLGYKSIVLTGSGGTKEAFRGVSHAKELRDHIMEQVDLSHRSMMGQYVPPAPQQPQAYYQQPRNDPPPAYADPLADLPPENPTTQLREVSTLIKAGKRNDAAQIVKGLLQTHPQSADVWYLAGYLQTDPNKKRAAYEKALKLNPQHKLANSGLAELPH